MKIQTLFVTDTQAYTSVAIENIPRDTILPMQKLLKDNMNSPGKMSTLLGPDTDCLRITKVHNSNKVNVIKYSSGWLKKNRFDVFYVDYTVPVGMVIDAFNSNNFQALIQLVQENKPIESVETYSVF